LVAGQGGVGEEEGGDEVEGGDDVEGWTTRWSGQGGGDEVEDWTTQRRATMRWSRRGGGMTRRLDGDEQQRSGDVVNRTWRGCAGAAAPLWSGRGICGVATLGVGRWGEAAPGERGG
jgi:hypothetical protein